MRTKQEILKSHAEECSRRAGLANDPLMRHHFFDLAAQWLELAAVQQALTAQRQACNGSYRFLDSKVLPAWRRGQSKAFEMAMLGEALETTLGILVRTVCDVHGEGVRAAFYLANSTGTTLHHVVGMPAAYAEAVDGFKIGANSLACGLATHIGRPVLTADVATEPLWAPWRSMADKFDYRGCWSFPIRTSVRNGTLAIYSRCPREATGPDVDFAEQVTQTAAILIDRHIHEQHR